MISFDISIYNLRETFIVINQSFFPNKHFIVRNDPMPAFSMWLTAAKTWFILCGSNLILSKLLLSHDPSTHTIPKLNLNRVTYIAGMIVFKSITLFIINPRVQITLTKVKFGLVPIQIRVVLITLMWDPHMIIKVLFTIGHGIVSLS